MTHNDFQQSASRHSVDAPPRRIRITIERMDGTWIQYTVPSKSINPVRACESAVKMALLAHPDASEVSADPAPLTENR